MIAKAGNVRLIQENEVQKMNLKKTFLEMNNNSIGQFFQDEIKEWIIYQRNTAAISLII